MIFEWRHYVEDDVGSEGIRDLLQLNPLMFTDEQQILHHFEQLLRCGAFALGKTPEGPLIEAPPHIAAEAEMVGPDESRQRQITPISNSIRLVLTITNAGTGPASNVVITFREVIDVQQPDEIEAIAPGATVLKAFHMPTYSPGSSPRGSVPELIELTYAGHGWSGGRFVLKRIEGSHPPHWSREEARMPIPNVQA